MPMFEFDIRLVRMSLIVAVTLVLLSCGTAEEESVESVASSSAVMQGRQNSASLEDAPLIVRKEAVQPAVATGDAVVVDSIREESFGVGILSLQGTCLYRVDEHTGLPLDIPVFPAEWTSWDNESLAVTLRNETASIGDRVRFGGGELQVPLLFGSSDCPIAPKISVDSMDALGPP